MLKNIIMSSFLLLSVTSFNGCTATETQASTGGGLLGGAFGYFLSSKENRKKNALIGGVLGALGGAGAGKILSDQQQSAKAEEITINKEIALSKKNQTEYQKGIEEKQDEKEVLNQNLSSQKVRVETLNEEKVNLGNRVN